MMLSLPLYPVLWVCLSYFVDDAYLCRDIGKWSAHGAAYPHHRPLLVFQNDAYVCTGVKVSELVGTAETVWVTQYRALSDADTAHHMLLFQCDDLTAHQRAVGKW